MVLLLRVQVAKLSLPLSSHPSLRLHHLLCLVGASRGLMALGCIKVLEIGTTLGAAGIVEVVDRVGARARSVGVGVRHSSIYEAGG